MFISSFNFFPVFLCPFILTHMRTHRCAHARTDGRRKGGGRRTRCRHQSAKKGRRLERLASLSELLSVVVLTQGPEWHKNHFKYGKGEISCKGDDLSAMAVIALLTDAILEMAGKEMRMGYKEGELSPTPSSVWGRKCGKWRYVADECDISSLAARGSRVRVPLEERTNSLSHYLPLSLSLKGWRLMEMCSSDRCFSSVFHVFAYLSTWIFLISLASERKTIYSW